MASSHLSCDTPKKMRTRKEIKEIGRASYRFAKWPSIMAACFTQLALMPVSMSGAGVILLAGPLAIGLNHFYIHLIQGLVEPTGDPFTQAVSGYGRKLGGYWWHFLFQFLWMFVPVVGIVKMYAYAMTPYILSDCIDVKAKDALKLSMRIMKGKKWKLFVFQLSFIGWELLNVLTLGILGIFFVSPYVKSSMACWYLEAREDALRNGIISEGQINGESPVG